MKFNMTDYDENEVEGCRMSYRDELARRYGWPLKIHARGYDAYLVGAQPLESGPAPIYRFPGGDSLVDECEMLPAEEASDEKRNALRELQRAFIEEVTR